LAGFSTLRDAPERLSTQVPSISIRAWRFSPGTAGAGVCSAVSIDLLSTPVSIERNKRVVRYARLFNRGNLVREKFHGRLTRHPDGVTGPTATTGAIPMKFGIHNPSWFFGPDPAEAFEAAKAKTQWAENHGFAWFSVMDHLIQIGG